MSTDSVAVRRAVLADAIPGALTRDVALVVGGACLTGVAAQIHFVIPPISPVPFTGQTFAVLLVGATLGTWRAFGSLALYLFAGMAGVPWFAGGAHGVGGAAFGYLVGFVLAATLVGELARRGGDRTPLRTVGTMVAGSAVIYALGVAWLVGPIHLGLSRAIAVGVVPFLVWDLVKVAVAAGLLPGTWAMVRRFRNGV